MPIACVLSFFAPELSTALSLPQQLLKNFVMGRMMLEPNLDPMMLITDFCRNYYGLKATPHVLRYMEILYNATKSAGFYLCLLQLFVPSTVFVLN